MRRITLVLACICGTNSIVSAQDTTGNFTLSDDRIAEKSQELQRRAWIARWTWRATEGISAAALIGGLSVYWYYRNADHGDLTQDENSNVSDHTKTHDQRILKLEAKLKHVDTSEMSDDNKSIFSWDYIIPKLKQGSLGLGKQVLMMQLMGISKIAAQSITSLCLPATAYRMVMQPVYLSDLSHFITNSTRFYEGCARLSLFAKGNFAHMQYIRDAIVYQLIDDVESILAFLSCAQDYMSDEIHGDISTMYDGVQALMNQFLIDVYAQDHNVVTSAIQQLQQGIEMHASLYNKCIERQSTMEWLTAL